MSPAKTWKSFGELEIVINTPYYVSSCSIEGFTKTETGYTVKLNGLPDGELTFNLSTSENPVRATPPYSYIGWIVLGVIGGVVVLTGGVVAFVVIRKRRAHRGKT